MKVIITMLLCALGATAFGQNRKEMRKKCDIIRRFDATILTDYANDAYHADINYTNNDLDTTWWHVSDSLMGTLTPMPQIIYPFNYIKVSNDTIIHIQYPSSNDTLEINDIAIRFIKIGDKVFEIKRGAEIVPVAPLPKREKITLRDGELTVPTWRNAMPSVQLYNLQN